MPLMTGAARKRMAVWVRQARPARRITYLPSKLNTSPLALVPTNALTVRTVRRMPPPLLLYKTGEHATVVADVHDVLLHAADTPSDAVALGSIEWKFKPEIVTDALAVPGTFPRVERPLKLTTGAARRISASDTAWTLSCKQHGEL